LLEIDIRLNKINPHKYKDSINTDLKAVQKTFNEGKQARDLKFESEMNIIKEKSKINKDKKTIFDQQTKDERKIVYKDYLKENREKKTFADFLTHLEIEREALNYKEIDESKKGELLVSLENYHKDFCETEEYKERLRNIKGCYDDQFEQKIDNLEKRELLKKSMIDQLEQKFKGREEDIQRRVEEIKEDMRKPYEDLMKDVEKEYKDNKVLLDRCEDLEKNIKITEKHFEVLNEKMKIVKSDAENYEKLWEEADEVYKSFDWGDDIGKLKLEYGTNEKIDNETNSEK
jgi:hypothetical protein